MSTVQPGAPRPARTRAITKLLAAGAVMVVVAFVLAAVAAVAFGSGSPDTTRVTGSVPAPARTASDPAAPLQTGEDGAVQGGGELDAIAAASMPQFPVAAAQPHALAPESTSPAPLRLPEPTDTTTGIPGGFPRTPEGAVAQLKALDEVGMAGMDPDVYAASYRAVSLPGAPDPAATPLHQIAVGSRAAGGLAPSGPVAGVTVSFQVAAGLVKGVTRDGSGVAACVLGVLTAVTDTSSVRVGVGDCQALRWEQGRWRISPTVLAAVAPATWPGTAEAHRAGYRAVLGEKVADGE